MFEERPVAARSTYRPPPHGLVSLPIRLDSQQPAGADRQAVEQNHASSAYAHAAVVVGASEVEAIAEHVDERIGRLD